MTGTVLYGKVTNYFIPSREQRDFTRPDQTGIKDAKTKKKMLSISHKPVPAILRYLKKLCSEFKIQYCHISTVIKRLMRQRYH